MVKTNHESQNDETDETEEGTPVGQKKFTVVMRGPAAIVFWENEEIQIRNVPTSVGPVDVAYATRWLDRAEQARIPGQLWIEIVGAGDILEDVLVPYANAGIATLAILALASNASIKEPDIELGFESTPGISQRDYFQSYLQPESGAVHVARPVNRSATIAVINALTRSPHSDRLARAANQYRLALGSWKMGRETMSLAHLWMGLEALTKVKIRKDCSILGLKGEKDLAKHLGVDLKNLDSSIRKALLQNDKECYKKAKTASDGFEHGFLEYDAIREHAEDVRHRLAAYIRSAILELADVPADAQDILLHDPYDKPLGYWPVTKYVRGQLLGDSPTLAREGSKYPFLRWKPTITSCKPDAVGKLNSKFTENFTAELADGISFKLQSVEVWEPQ